MELIISSSFIVSIIVKTLISPGVVIFSVSTKIIFSATVSHSIRSPAATFIFFTGTIVGATISLLSAFIISISLLIIRMVVKAIGVA